MRQEKIQNIKYYLLRKMEELRDIAGNTLQRLKNSADKHPDMCDEAAYEYSKAIELAVRGKEKKMMLDIQEAIMRIDRGLFGFCDHCGKKIPEERLVSAPLSKSCFECQSNFENSDRVTGNRFRMKAKYRKNAN